MTDDEEYVIIDDKPRIPEAVNTSRDDEKDGLCIKFLDADYKELCFMQFTESEAESFINYLMKSFDTRFKTDTYKRIRDLALYERADRLQKVLSNEGFDKLADFVRNIADQHRK